MAITSTVSPDGNQVTIYIQGRFDFSSHQDFRSAYEKLTKVPSQYRVDLQGTTYLDSSALSGGRLAKGKTVNIPLPGHGDSQSFCGCLARQRKGTLQLSHGARGRVFFST
jgi:hypothetical protein